MASKFINSLETLRDWLKGKSEEHAKIIAVRGALRLFPFALSVEDENLEEFAQTCLRANLLSWATISFLAESEGSAWIPPVTIAGAAARAVSDRYSRKMIDLAAVNATFASARAANSVSNYGSNVVTAAADVAHAAIRAVRFDGRRYSGFDKSTAIEMMWSSFNEDIEMFDSPRYGLGAYSERLWIGQPTDRWRIHWSLGREKLLILDPNYAFWTEWYDRRIRGEGSGFDIPGDANGVHERSLLRRIARTTDKDFWSKGCKHVNAELTRWLEEARELSAKNLPPISAEAHGVLELTGSGTIEVGPVPAPPQEYGATAYGINVDGKIDRLPHTNQARLLDTPSQRRAYADIRAVMLELRDEGQRLGSRLHKGLNRLADSMPERFEDAEVDLVWRDGNALRRLYFAHCKVESNPEPDPAKLEPAIAESLGGLLDLFNNFAFTDNGLNEKDHRSIPPQQRPGDERERQAAALVLDAILTAAEIATEPALADISAEVEDQNLPADEAYSAQALAQSNKTIRNWIAGMLTGVGQTLGNSKLIGRRIAIGAATAAGGLALTALVTNHSAIVAFVGAHAAILSNYVTIAYPAYPHLPDLIEQAKQAWHRFMSN